MNASLAGLAEEIAARDARDAQRTVAPLRPATDAELLDTTGMPIARVCEWALMLAARRLSIPVIP